ncbi:MAG: alpha/beta hydrolase [Casimicrobiaceae bacterium]
MKHALPLAGAPRAVQATMAEIGPIWATNIRAHSDRVKAAYAPLLVTAPKDAITVSRNCAYGAHPRQVLDVFRPEGVIGAPVVVFVHGGAFVRGDKCTSTEIYDNVLYWFARQGYLGINVEYRLAPEASYPAGAVDVALAVAWLRENVARFGGDPSRLLLIGHSAGGTHVASYAYDPLPGYLGEYATAIVLISARLRADQAPENPNASGVKAYFGDDVARYDERSPGNFGAASELPVFIVNAEFENPLLDVYGLELAHNIAVARGKAPRYLRLAHHNHMSIMAHFNTEEEILGREILDFFAAAERWTSPGFVSGRRL